MQRTAFILAAALACTAAHADTLAVIETDQGNIELILDEQKAPQTVANFKRYAEKGFYRHTVFHRVIPGFMIQGGGFTADMIQKPTEAPIKNEAANGLKNRIGTIAMARTANPHSATSQFFINVADNKQLDYTAANAEGYGYTVFGRVSKGMEVVNRIAQVRTVNRLMHQNVPATPIVIKDIRIVK